MRNMTIAVVGLGGFGHRYVDALLNKSSEHHVQMIAGIDPQPERCEAIAEIRRRQIPVYPNLAAFLADGHNRPNLIALASPIQLHCEQVIQSLACGCHVICEKPLGASPAQTHQMIEARDKSGMTVAIAYQWAFASATQRLKRDILAGRFGAPRRFATTTAWPRNYEYYSRNRWAGRICCDDGRLVLDSPANNACAHYLHYMFYLLGDTAQTSAQPARVSAELYRANRIENYDTAAISCTTTSGVELLFLASHVTERICNPQCRFEFENATIVFGEHTHSELRVCHRDGHEESYGTLPEGGEMEKLWATIDAIRDGSPTLCGLEAASAQTLCMYAAQHSVKRIATFPGPIVRREEMNGPHRFVVEGLNEVLDRCYDRFKMPSEIGAPWAIKGECVDASKIDRTVEDLSQLAR